MPWQQGELPHFTSKAALTPELYDMIVEFRTTSILAN
ncbi:hypothetical protein AYX15_00240 [Cryptococcus neoformans]|nr:hypothetical protein AYX15_00240 [Cryptococcus neoformans var. grubii]